MNKDRDENYHELCKYQLHFWHVAKRRRRRKIPCSWQKNKQAKISMAILEIVNLSEKLPSQQQNLHYIVYNMPRYIMCESAHGKKRLYCQGPCIKFAVMYGLDLPSLYKKRRNSHIDKEE